ncbi:MAG: HAD family phosphatase [Oceanospirillaceae bacterium]|nr:HAD family phosphatase [Oceanospirillaceae bacterium]
MKNVIFDMDGLLIDSEPTWKWVEQQALQQALGLELSLTDLKRFTGRATRDFVRLIAQQYPQLNVDQPGLMQLILDMMAEQITEAPLLPGALDLIHYLQEQQTPMAIASSTPRRLIQSVVARHNLPIEIITSGAEVAASKPHPEVFLQAAERLGADPFDCWVFEDSLNGVIAGRAASMQVVAVPAADYAPMAHFSIASRIDASLVDTLAALRAGEIS